VTARRAKRENGGLGEDPPGSTMTYYQVKRNEVKTKCPLEQQLRLAWGSFMPIRFRFPEAKLDLPTLVAHLARSRYLPTHIGINIKTIESHYNHYL
jgi:hypothetical protein